MIDGDEIKQPSPGRTDGRAALCGRLQENAWSRSLKSGKTGRVREKWVRRYRAPRPEDDNAGRDSRAKLAEKLPEWEAFDIVPSESIGDLSNYDRGHRLYGMYRWIRIMFSPRQLLCHGVERRGLPRNARCRSHRRAGSNDLRKTAYGYSGAHSGHLAQLQQSRRTLGQHDRPSALHLRPARFRIRVVLRGDGTAHVVGVGYDWAIEKTAKCIRRTRHLWSVRIAPAASPVCSTPPSPGPRPIRRRSPSPASRATTSIT